MLVAIVFTETGLLIGFFLPGDSLLITAGLVAATGHLNIWWLNGLLIVAAVVGDSVGYAIGWRAGPRLFTRPKSLLFNPSHIERTRAFYARHGAKTIVIARFVPIIRTFAPGRGRGGPDGVPALPCLQCRRRRGMGDEHDVGRLRCWVRPCPTSATTSTWWWSSSSCSR